MKTFTKGGVHPPENKLTANCPIEYLSVPRSVTIPVSQHIGAPANIIVNKGDSVLTGQVIAESKGFVSAYIHSSVSGKVNKIDTVTDTSGYKQTAVFIDVEGDEWVETIDRSEEIVTESGLSGNEIVQRCLKSGIVGLGGATFPSHVKLTVPAGKKCNILIINGVECEPYLTSDHRLMLERGEEVLMGVSLLMKALGVEKSVVGIENNKKDAIEHISRLATGFKGISVYPLKVKYPQGAEKQLIKALINREVPSGKLPLDVNAVVHNVGTCFAVYEAVIKNKPLFERVVTITGHSVARPGNYMVRTGTPVMHLIEAAGGIPEDTGKIVSGGPMMGKAICSTEVPVVKGTSGIVLFPSGSSERNPSQPCIRCAKCVDACPLGLEPFLLMTLTEKELFERAEKERITDCMECGSCSFICPANRPLLDYIRLGKSTVIKMARERISKK
ncbi:MAG TPA: electron transport complex subunit RsxC [Bacteroidales bacterium]|nr:electron transport complex subunit RsxC [Bacteroidales bacterium]HPF03145.1 electron transport complex subunit RsxC [Bacteroidales bacterium]HPJ59493.1 electron transport complex subunit RsxC [Bacteroidales bacterium]HPR12876.1 electron transport complex subunit RsxC [Bacteroidales bacterium]HRW85097.1 electron transport complex subunit RsxC [Bacteroidales bacterium]